jgi:hypothetical protein
MVSVPKSARGVIEPLAAGFSQRVFARIMVLLFAAVLTTGRRTVSNVLRTVQSLAPGHACSYHRVLSRRRWRTWRLARALAEVVLRTCVPTGVVACCGDDTVDEHRGKKVYGKGCHRDAVRSTHSYTAYRWGHKWVVLCILVELAFASRPWALPVLVALYRPKEWNEKQGRRHKTPAQLMRQLLAVLIRWFPERKFRFAGDGGFGTHDLARFAQRHGKRLAIVSRFYPDANLYDPPPKPRRKKNGRPRKKGRKRAAPQHVVKSARRTRLTVRWYGGGTRRVEVVTRTGHWYKAGEGLVEVRWVFVHDLTGTHRDEYFFTTDVSLSAKQIIEAFAGRWSIETTFQEVRAHVGLETTRGRSENTVLRAAPSLFGLYSIVTLLYGHLPRRDQQPCIHWAGKTHVTFSDAVTAVRHWLWRHWAFATHGDHDPISKLHPKIQRLVLYALAQAA